MPATSPHMFMKFEPRGRSPSNAAVEYTASCCISSPTTACAYSTLAKSGGNPCDSAISTNAS